MGKFQIWNIGKWQRGMIRVMAMGHTLVVLVIGTALFFVALGLGGIVENRLQSSPVSSMKGFAAAVSSSFFADMLGMEIPHLDADKRVSAFSAEQMTTFAFQLLTGVNPQDPKSLVAREIPGMAAGNPVLLRTGSGNRLVEAPEDYQPDPGITGSGEIPPAPPGKEADEEPSASEDTGQEVDPPVKGSAKTDGNRILIYHSHPREAYNSLLSKSSSNPNSSSASANVSVAGSFVADRLKQQGIGTLHVNKDYVTAVKDYNWNYSYKYSRQTVKEALAENDELTYLIDIHRDSQRHDKTTAVVNGVKYAKIYFIIGHDNKKWRENEAFAARIHEKLEKAYPGVSRGVWGKDGGGGNNGEYNQSLSPNSILIEIGGIDNTEDELKRTSEALADMLGEVYWEDQKVMKADSSNGKAASKTAGNTGKSAEAAGNAK
ncbi:stage II sporulation protein P [Paenibacillus sp. P96]|uniref:Stage II sporulation protein P n=1 Tax=Paenibacillus zeirhizosphaerae TaxID=2987519 RepID=A0ABT9FQL4_9BACL|nr:stage II sporulation protein P [Paenibacillus sp. P96]MDP4097020.1 stage II sporulation protein P [Paenibacillus sp. P96]